MNFSWNAGSAEDLVHLGIDLHHDVARRAAGGGQAEPGAGLITRHGLARRSAIRRIAGTRLGLPTPSTLSFFSAAGCSAEAEADRHQIDVAGDDVVERRRRTAIVHGCSLTFAMFSNLTMFMCGAEPTPAVP